MSIDKKKIKKIIGISVAVLGAAFVGMSILAKKKNHLPSMMMTRSREIHLRVKRPYLLKIGMIKKMPMV